MQVEIAKLLQNFTKFKSNLLIQRLSVPSRAVGKKFGSATWQLRQLKLKNGFEIKFRLNYIGL